MKHLIIYAHLNPKSFTKAIVDQVELTLKNKGDDFKTIDLYSDKFNPILGMPDVEHLINGKELPNDIKEYQDLITWADNLIVVYPMWWGQMPAILKGFLDRVFLHGFAFRITPSGGEGLLKGKTAHVFINTGTPNSIYEETKMHDSQERIINEGVFDVCGIKSEITFFGQVSSGTDELRKSYLETIKTKF